MRAEYRGLLKTMTHTLSILDTWPWNCSVLVVASIAEAPKRVSCCCQLQIKIKDIQKMLLCCPGMKLSLIISDDINGTAP